MPDTARLIDRTHPMTSVVENEKYIDLMVFGPAVVVNDGSIFANCDTMSSAEECLIEVPKSRKRTVGVTILKNCLFERCRLYNISFLGTVEELEGPRRGIIFRDGVPPSR